MKKKTARFRPWMGALGLLGFLGFLPKHGGGHNYLFFVFFAFFSWFFWGLLCMEKVDERLVENQNRAMRLIGALFAMLSFLLIFLLDRGVTPDTVLLTGSLGYAGCFVAAPALTWYLDRRG